MARVSMGKGLTSSFEFEVSSPELAITVRSKKPMEESG